MNCPKCGQALKKVLYPNGSMLNEYQWESIRAGDYYCESCPDNGRGNDKLCYWWKSELTENVQVPKEIPIRSQLAYAQQRISALEAAMSINMKNPKTPLEIADAIANLIAQMYLAHQIKDEKQFNSAHSKASDLAFELTNALEGRE